MAERNRRRVYSAETLPAVAHARNLLEQAGIECYLRNEHAGSIMGEVPIFAIWPELWVRHERDIAAAEGIIAELIEAAAPAAGPDWTCPACGAANGPQFGACWQCERPHPG